MNKTIVVTGGAGFIGANFALHYKKQHPEDNLICFDNLNRKGSELNVPRLEQQGITFIKGDVRKREDLQFNEKIDVIVECSAEPSVLAGLKDSPEYVIDTNLGGAINCLELARKNKSKFIFLSTSRVYPYNLLTKLKCEKSETRFKISEDNHIFGLSQEGINEEFPLIGIRSIYGTTKLCAEQLIQEYGEAFGMEYVINRCGVVAGPWQMGKVDQGIFSFWMLGHYFKKDLQYIGFGGTGLQVRDLLHVDDLCELVTFQIDNLEKCTSRTYNVGGGPNVSLSLQETTALCQEITGNTVNIGSVPETRPADIPIYISDNRKIESELGWKPKRSAKDILVDIYEWVKKNEEAIRGTLV